MNPPKLTGSGLSPLANTPVLSLEDTVSWYESEKSHCRSFFDLPKTLQQLLEHFFSEQFIRWHGASIMMDEAFKAFVRENVPLMTEFARLVTDDPELELDEKRAGQTEKTVNLVASGKTIRLDSIVHCKHRHMLNFEYQSRLPDVKKPENGSSPETIQRRKAEELKGRALAYSIMNSMSEMHEGTPYRETPVTDVFFICRFDPFGENRWLYTSGRAEDWTGLSYYASPLLYFLNLRAWNNPDIPPRLRAVCHYLWPFAI
jgi:hypothetical protein